MDRPIIEIELHFILYGRVRPYFNNHTVYAYAPDVTAVYRSYVDCIVRSEGRTKRHQTAKYMQGSIDR